MTMINFRRTGSSPRDELSIDLDLGTISASAAQRFERLLDESNFFDIPLVQDLRVGPDEYGYSLTVVAGNNVHTVHVTDSSMPRSLRPLLDELTTLAQTTS